MFSKPFAINADPVTPAEFSSPSFKTYVLGRLLPATTENWSNTNTLSSTVLKIGSYQLTLAEPSAPLSSKKVYCSL